ncbi:DUF397 domain-containing protein [Umezawaea sp. Da 62-37]|uniref:DUF397 domain-containing protein n=1 Tax=Umezawaea sp. Da 62-37 TaxID=3075927 RepID=UPI0028F70126|nr:DUF397 domain-containing protein [Umezawaea sp. Da 62-37]WNV89252.1 DUF397 domain-containing protein [Umezawaea sp. Da 62-37]
MSEAISLSIVDSSGPAWRKSSYSGGGTNGNCVEVAFVGDVVAIRDSKNPAVGMLLIPAEHWRSFLVNGFHGLGNPR